MTYSYKILEDGSMVPYYRYSITTNIKRNYITF